jgi:hypothetical protein
VVEVRVEAVARQAVVAARQVVVAARQVVVAARVVATVVNCFSVDRALS